MPFNWVVARRHSFFSLPFDAFLFLCFFFCTAGGPSSFGVAACSDIVLLACNQWDDETIDEMLRGGWWDAGMIEI